MNSRIAAVAAADTEDEGGCPEHGLQERVGVSILRCRQECLRGIAARRSVYFASLTTPMISNDRCGCPGPDST